MAGLAREEDRLRRERGAGGTSGLFGWLAALLGVWIVGGVTLVVWADNQGLIGDIGASPYHSPAYLGLLALAITGGVLLLRSALRGDSWRNTFPPGYGVLGVGLLAALAYLVVDVGWREGVGIGVGIEGSYAPSRVLLLVALALIAGAPLHAALTAQDRARSILPALVSAGLLLAVLGPPGGLHPAQNPWLERPPDLVGGEAELWLMDADGARQTRLLEADEGVDIGFAAWSPDGRRIAYTRSHGPAHDPTQIDASIWVASTDGSETGPLVGGEGWQWIPAWSPDGEWIAYTQEAAGGPGRSSGPVAPGPGYGPHGAAFVPSTIETSRAEIWRVPADGSGLPERMTDSAGDDRAPTYAPDGSLVAFDSTRDGNTEIYVMAADGSAPRRLTNHPAADWAASWSPDGLRIAFNSDRSGTMEIFVMAADGSDVRQLTDVGTMGIGALANRGPSWSADGSRVAFASWQGDRFQIWSVDSAGGGLRPLSRSPASHDDMWTSGWGPDGRIAFSRAAKAGPDSTAWVRESLGVAGMLISVALLVLVTLLVLRLDPPVGAFALILTLGTALLAAPAEEWRFVPAALLAGLAVDIVAWRASVRRRSALAASTAGVSFVAAYGLTVLLTTGLGWTPTLLIGTALAAGAIGLGLALTVRQRDRYRAMSSV